jgi:hypothetical protein
MMDNNAGKAAAFLPRPGHLSPERTQGLISLHPPGIYALCRYKLNFLNALALIFSPRERDFECSIYGRFEYISV